MTKNRKIYLLLSLFFMASSGVAIYLLDTFFPVETDYGTRSNPWLSEMKLIHNGFNFLFIFCVGAIFPNHIYPGLVGKKKERRGTGVFISLIIFFLVFSGVFLLYIGDEAILNILEDLHWWGGVSFIVVFLFHLFKKRSNKGR